MSTERVQKYITFLEAENPGKRTRVWHVLSTQGGKMGVIKWYGGWRKYVYHPSDGEFLDADGMAYIGAFCKERTDTHMGMLAATKSEA